LSGRDHFKVQIDGTNAPFRSDVSKPHSGPLLEHFSSEGPAHGTSGRSASAYRAVRNSGFCTDLVTPQHALLDDPTPYSTHSLRAGFVTECCNRGVSETKIRRTTRHTSFAGLDPYDRPTEHFDNAALVGEWW